MIKRGIRQRTVASLVSGCPNTQSGGLRSLRQFSERLEHSFVGSNDPTNETPKSTDKSTQPRASNPASFQKNFFVPDEYHEKKRHAKLVALPWARHRGDHDPATKAQTATPHRAARFATTHRLSLPSTSTMHMSPNGTLGHHLKAQGETIMPTSTWVQVEGISPISSLEAMLAGIHEVLDAEEVLGMIDLDALWSVGHPVPFLPPLATHKDNENSNTQPTNKPDKWVRKAMLILSPFGRPTGWYLQFDNRSVVYALLKHAEENPVQCTWKTIKVQEYQGIGNATDVPTSHGNYLIHKDVSDHTLRVENCPPTVSDISVLNFFSRYDLQFGERAVQRWQGMTSDGKKCPPTTCLVHFADASWARAALREKQATFIQKLGQRIVADESNPQPLRLIQYPRQML